MADLNGRETITALLKGHLPTTWRLIPHPDDLGRIDRPTVMVSLDSVIRTPQSPRTSRTAQFTVLVAVPQIAPGRADDAIEEAGALVLDALDLIDGLTWTACERDVSLTNYPVFLITVSALIPKE